MGTLEPVNRKRYKDGEQADMFLVEANLKLRKCCSGLQASSHTQLVCDPVSGPAQCHTRTEKTHMI